MRNGDTGSSSCPEHGATALLVAPLEERVDNLVLEIGRKEAALTPSLIEIQDYYHYIPDFAVARLSEKLAISRARIEEVVGFYPLFRRKEAGKHTIKVCIGTACHVKGANRVYEAFRSYLKIPEDRDTDEEKQFTLEKVACLGCCMLAPAVQIDETTYGHLSPAGVPAVLADFIASRDRRHEPPVRAASRAEGVVRGCLCSSCAAAGAEEVLSAFRREISRRGLAVTVQTVGCTGRSFAAPLVEIETALGVRRMYERVKIEEVETILRADFPPRTRGGRLREKSRRVLEGLYDDSLGFDLERRIFPRPPLSSLDSGEQVHLATQQLGLLDPLDLSSYKAAGGFTALENLIASGNPGQVFKTIKDSGLRGRGGAGFPSHLKWEAVRKSSLESGMVPILVCNADEGDPGAFMDRMLLESFPFRIIEGMALAAWTLGATEGFIYCRREYPLALKQLRAAIAFCEKEGLLGRGCFGGGRSFRIVPLSGAGAFVCGEETALMSALEGGRGNPRYRPPYPSERGLWGHPTLIQNVETYSLVPWIIGNGAQAFKSIGTEKSPGTKTFALAGKVRKGGLVEVPLGTALITLVRDIGGGIEGDKRLKAVQIGGPSGGCVPAGLAHTPVDYEELSALGTMMGSGGLVVLDEDDCMVDIARYFMAFTQAESCGKCVYCRTGTKRMLEILDRLKEGKGRGTDLEELEHLGACISENSLCGLGKTAANPVLSTLRYFREEYEAHLQGFCPAGVCAALIRYEITEECVGCGKCYRVCPVEAVEGKPYERHRVDENSCTRCGQCRAVCPVGAVRVVRAEKSDG